MTPSAVVLRAGDARVVIEPDHGARLTSLVLAGREWLQQPVVEPRAAQPFDAFVRPDIAGWDEMVPTCVAVEHGGVALPDHGEVWSRPWDVVTVDKHELITRIRCATVALTVERRATLTDGELALRYVLENVGDRPAAAFWMAHPLFDATDLVAVEVHPGDAAVVSTVDSRQPGSAGDGTSGPLLAGDLEPGGYRKYRLGDVGVVEGVTLVRSDGPRLTVGWRADVPVHVQWWVDNGGVGPSPVVAPEPATAAGDDPLTAEARGSLPLLAPGVRLEVAISVVATAGP